MLWVAATLTAALLQTARNGTQRSLTGELGLFGATQVRFIYGLPFSLIFLAAVATVEGAPLPRPDGAVLLFSLQGAAAQILATGFLLLAMQERSFSVATALTKTEPVLAAVAGFMILGEAPTAMGALGIGVATFGILLLSFDPKAAARRASGKAALYGVLAGALFALSSVSFRGAIIELPTGSLALRATTILALTLLLQTAMLMLWMALFNRSAARDLLRSWRVSLLAGATGAAASQFWFIAFALTTAANVRTLALVEVLFAQAVGRRLFRQAVTARELSGMGLIMAGVALLLLGVL